MNFIRRIRLSVGLLLVGVMGMMGVMTASAEVGLKSFGITNSIAANATHTSAANVGVAVKIDNRDNAGLMLKFQGNAAATEAITVTFARSPDNSNWETTPRFTWAAALNGNTAVVAYTNLSTAVVGGAGYLKVISIQNGNGGTVHATNASLHLIDKKIEIGH
jgi:hypothetical protein